MAKEGYIFVAPLIVGGIVFWGLGIKIAAVILAPLALFVVFFFRDPERSVPSDSNVIVSPADGKVVKIRPGEGGTLTQLSIFLSLFDVHINRSPVAGTIACAEYKPGRFKAAFKDSASHENEQNILTINHATRSVTVKQIAGVLARRIVCWKKAGDRVNKGERIGMIRFGSRVDLLLPSDVRLTVTIGDKVKGGESVIGTYREL